MVRKVMKGQTNLFDSRVKRDRLVVLDEYEPDRGAVTVRSVEEMTRYATYIVMGSGGKRFRLVTSSLIPAERKDVRAVLEDADRRGRFD